MRLEDEGIDQSRRSARGWTSWLLLAITTVSGCIAFSPFETDLADDERNRTEVNIGRLAAQPAPERSFRFAVLSDSHQHFDDLCELADMLNARGDLAFVLHLGDMTDVGLREEFRWALECLETLDVPYFTAIGNHDTLSNGRDVYRSMFGATNYSFVYGDVRFVVFDGNHREPGWPKNVLDWLAEVTAPSPEAGSVIIAAHQRPPGTEYEDLLEDNGVRAQVLGHVHELQARLVRGIPSVEVDNASAKHWALFTVTETGIAVESCDSEHCTAVPL